MKEKREHILKIEEFFKRYNSENMTQKQFINGELYDDIISYGADYSVLLQEDYYCDKYYDKYHIDYDIGTIFRKNKENFKNISSIKELIEIIKELENGNSYSSRKSASGILKSQKAIEALFIYVMLKNKENYNISNDAYFSDDVLISAEIFLFNPANTLPFPNSINVLTPFAIASSID
jgi:hypothetical protein